MKSAPSPIATPPNSAAMPVEAASAPRSPSALLPVACPTAVAAKAAVSAMPSTATLRMLARLVTSVASAHSSSGVVCTRVELRNAAISTTPPQAATEAARPRAVMNRTRNPVSSPTSERGTSVSICI